MSPKIPVKSLYDITLHYFIEKVKNYLKTKVQKINFFNDFEQSCGVFLKRCQEEKLYIDENFSGPLR